MTLVPVGATAFRNGLRFHRSQGPNKMGQNLAPVSSWIVVASTSCGHP